MDSENRQRYSADFRCSVFLSITVMVPRWRRSVNTKATRRQKLRHDGPQYTVCDARARLVDLRLGVHMIAVQSLLDMCGPEW